MNRRDIEAVVSVMLTWETPMSIDIISASSKVRWFECGDILTALARIGVAKGSKSMVRDGFNHAKPGEGDTRPLVESSCATHSMLLVRGNLDDMVAMIWHHLEVERHYEEERRRALSLRGRISNIRDSAQLALNETEV